MGKLACVVFGLLVGVVAGADWALLVAGSNTYYNYRHQADVCHSYHVLINNGFPADNIVVMMYDDIARNSLNPVQNNLINQPNGPNVYDGCRIDYSRNDVTPDNFLAVLQGQSMQGVGSGRTIQSTSDDNVFVFFSDHGAVGLVAFPTEYLHAAQLNDTLTAMHAARKYKNMLLYIEACEAGSMFNNILSPSIGVLAITAADPAHSSYATYFDNERNTYLGDLFSVSWMQDSEATSPAAQTVGDQFAKVRKATNLSRVCDYGDTGLESLRLSVFQATSAGNAEEGVGRKEEGREEGREWGEVADSRDVEVMTLNHMVLKAGEEERGRLLVLLQLALDRRAAHDARMRAIVTHAASLVDLSKATAEDGPVTTDTVCNPPDRTVRDARCLQEMVTTMVKACGRFDDYALKHVARLNEFCNAGLAPRAIAATMVQTCTDIPLPTK